MIISPIILQIHGVIGLVVLTYLTTLSYVSKKYRKGLEENTDISFLPDNMGLAAEMAAYLIISALWPLFIKGIVKITLRLFKGK